jgi:hypothetical protein
MFVSRELVTPVGYTAAMARLANLIAGSALANASQSAWDDGLTVMIRVGPSVPLTRLVRAQFRDLVDHGETAVLTLRWEVIGPGAGLFPVLDADITLIPAGQEATLLRLDGSYRPPFGLLGAAIDRAIMNRVADATVRSFLTRVRDAISNPGTATAEGSEIRPEPGPVPDLA